MKPAPNTPECSLELQTLLRDAGFTDEFQVLMASTDSTEAIISSDQIRGVSFTGSTGGGRAVAEIAGRHLKKAVFELGGADPFIVLDGADIPLAVEKGIISRLNNSGQACINAKRFFVLNSVYDEFLDTLIEKLGDVETGDPLVRSTQVGPLAREDLYENLVDQVRRSVEAGCELAHGSIPESSEKGFLFPPVVLTDIPEGAPPQTEEFFGPVFSVFPVESAEEAVRRANDSAYGLGAAVFGPTKEAEAVALQVDSGMVFVNDFTRSDCRLPYGGVKNSGFGRECGAEGFREFVNIKPLWIA